MHIPRWLPLLLGTLTAVGPLSTDMYLPAFPAIEAAFGGRAGAAQITLATWFAGLAFGQLTQGTLADRFGRRLPLIIGSALFTLASAGCALAPDLTTLAIMRALAAFGGSASMVIPRAVVRDLTEGHAAARLMSRLILVMGAAPILAPTLGGLVLAGAGWQAIFWLVTGYGAICCALVWFALPETLPPAQRLHLRAGQLLARYAAILSERRFLTHALIQSSMGFGLFAYLGGSPGVFVTRFQLSPSRYGALFGCCAASFIIAAQIAPRLTVRYGAGAVLRAGILAYLAAALALTAFALPDRGPWWAMAIAAGATMGSMGFSMPNATVGALSRHAAQAGSASALLGTLQFCLGAISGLSVGLLADHTARPMALLVLVGAIGALAADAARRA